MKKDTSEKLRRILEIKESIAKLENELELILNPEKAVILPPDFSINEEVLGVVKSSPTGITIKEITVILTNKYPHFGIDRQKISSALIYLKSGKKLIESVSRGKYKKIDSSPTV